MEDNDFFSLKTLVIKLIDECHDAALLDFIYRLIMLNRKE